MNRQNECETGCITQSFTITEDQLACISTYLSLFTTFLHHLQLFLSLLPSKQSLFTSCLDEFPQLESFYTEVCIYQIIHESIQVYSFFYHSFIESSYSESSYSRRSNDYSERIYSTTTFVWSVHSTTTAFIWSVHSTQRSVYSFHTPFLLFFSFYSS